MNAAQILAVLLSLPPSRLDADELAADRAARLAPVASAIAEVSRTPREAAALIALGAHETHFARLVQAGRCDLMPAGERCDDGRARGLWQLHRAACREAWTMAPETSLVVEARCAVRLLRWHGARGRKHTLTPLHAAFAGYAGAGWHWSGAEERVRTTRSVLAALARTGASS